MKKPARPIDPIAYKVFELQPRKGDRTKIEILEATIQCLATIGLGETSLDAVGKRLKIKSAHIVYHFKDKQSLFEAVISYVVAVASEVFVETIVEGETPEEKLCCYIDGLFDWMKRYPDHARVMVLFYYLSTYDEGLKKLQTRVREAGARRIQAIIEPIFDRARKKGSIPAESVAHLLYCALTGFYVEYLATEKKVGFETYHQRVIEISRALISSMAN